MGVASGVPIKLGAAERDGERNPDRGAGDAILDAHRIGKGEIEVIILDAPADADFALARLQGLHVHGRRDRINDHLQVRP